MTIVKDRIKKRKINPNLKRLIVAFHKGYSGVVMEGSSRSGKTYSGIDFLFYLGANYETPLVINVIKETYSSFKTTLYDDFSKRLNDYGLPNPFDKAKEVSSFRIWNHKVNFIGADKPSKFEGASCDILWINESLPVAQLIFDNAEMRCRMFWFMDYNPSVTLHYIFDSVIPRRDVSFIRTTFEDNPFISRQELNKILSYEPTDPRDRDLPLEERRPHALNIEQGTADDFMWSVYGLGLRMNRDGLIFQDVKWIDAFPSQDLFERVGYGMDLGFKVSPTSICKSAAIGKELISECLVYTPTETPEECSQLIHALGLNETPIWCDSAHPIFIAKLNALGCKVYAIKKIPIMDRIALTKNWKLTFVKSRFIQKEQENYSFRKVNGIVLDEPIKGHDHFFDSLGYNVLANFR